MTKKDYIAIANAIKAISKNIAPTNQLPTFVEEFCGIAKADNANFKPETFKTAAGF